MVVASASALADLYLEDETAWLEQMATAIREGRFSELDYANLQEYLSDMAIRDRREVESRLAELMMHMLKWEFQPSKRSTSWEVSIDEQKEELGSLLGSAVLRNHALEILEKAYLRAVRNAKKETQLPRKTFPKACPYELDTLLAVEDDDEELDS